MTGWAVARAAQERHRRVLEQRESDRRLRYPPPPPPSSVKVLRRTPPLDWALESWPETR